MNFIYKCSLYFSKMYWKYNWKKLSGEFLRNYALFMLIAEPVSWFYPQITEWTRGNWLLFLIWIAIVIILSMVRNSPTSLVSCRLNGKDISIEIRIGNIFDIEGAYVISTNSTFDTDLSKGLISPKSLQGQFTEKYYDKVEHLDKDLEEALEQEFPILKEEIENTKRYEIGGKAICYEIGTVAKVCPQGQIVYLVAIGHMNKDGKAYSTFEEVLEGLGKLWYYISEHGELEPVVVPVLGTGLTRLANTRENMVREIIKSFITACSEKKFCEKLTIVISPKDYREHKIDLRELGNYLQHHCRYTILKDKSDIGKGKPIS